MQTISSILVQNLHSRVNHDFFWARINREGHEDFFEPGLTLLKFSTKYLKKLGPEQKFPRPHYSQQGGLFKWYSSFRAGLPYRFIAAWKDIKYYELWQNIFFAYWVILHASLSSADFTLSRNACTIRLSNSLKMAKMLGLISVIWVQTVCKG